MKFVQFFQPGLFSEELIEGTGDRSVIIYDDRGKHTEHLIDAAAECKRRGFTAFQFRRGQSLTRNSNITPIVKLDCAIECAVVSNENLLAFAGERGIMLDHEDTTPNQNRGNF